MGDDNGLEILIPKRTSKKKTFADPFDIINSQQWYQDYVNISDVLTNQLMNVNDKLRENIVQDVVQFISSYQCTVERIPIISLFTGFSLPDHSSMISAVANSIKNDEKTNCLVVDLNSTKTSSLKTFIETIVHDFVNCSSEDDGFFENEEDNNFLPRSKFSLLRLTDWYANNYGRLDGSMSKDSEAKITHLVVVIPDIGAICKQILNDFLRTISPFRNRLPFMFLIGVPYTLNTFEKRFSSDVYSKLAFYPFQSQPSVAFLDTVLEEVFLSKNCVFHMDSSVFKILGSAYTNYNFSVKEFIRSVKLCVLEHFSQSPVHATFCCNPENNNMSSRIDGLTDEDIALILDLPSIQKYNTKRKINKEDMLTISSLFVKGTLKDLYNEFKIGMSRFNVAVRCCSLLMKSLKKNTLTTSTREIYTNVMCPERRKDWLDSNLSFVAFASKHNLLPALKEVESMLREYEEQEIFSIRSKLSTLIKQIEKSQNVVKSSPIRSPIDSITPTKATKSPIKALKSPAKSTRSSARTSGSPMKATRSPAKVTKSPLDAIKSPLRATNSTPKNGLTPRALFADGLKKNACKEKLQSEYGEARSKVLDFLKQEFLKLFLKSLDDIPLRELFIYDDSDKISSAMGNFFLAALNNALENPVSYLECKCCNPDTPDQIVKTMPDLAIVFKLYKEYGNIINLYDWFQQFRSFVDKKNHTDDDINPDIFRRFHLATQELHLLGYLSHVKKKSNGAEYVSKLIDF